MKLLEKIINNKRFVLVENSIIEENVEAIVNPANENLLHGGGLAGLISRRGGIQIQSESDRVAPVPTGEAAYTSAGDLPFKFIIHAVGPVWKGGVNNEEVLLNSAVSASLRLADELKLTSISLPCISTGVFSYPLKEALKIIVDAIFSFMTMDSSLKEIHLCEFSPEKAMDIKEMILAQFSDYFDGQQWRSKK